MRKPALAHGDSLLRQSEAGSAGLTLANGTKRRASGGERPLYLRAVTTRNVLCNPAELACGQKVPV